MKLNLLTPNRISLLAFFFCFFFFHANGQINLNADTTQGCAPLSINFSNTSTIGNSYYWYFGDGNGFYFQGTDTSYTYVNSGFYSCTLYAYDSIGNYLGSNYISIEVTDAITSFYQSATNVCPGTNVSFNSYYSGNSFSWNFGDGTTSTGQWANHTYSNFGNYNVTLIADGICGIDTIIQPISVDSSGTTNSDFGYWPDNICPGQQVNFYPYDQSGSNYYWDFGDGTNSSLASPNHTYNLPGNYTATVIMTNGCGNIDTTTKYIEVGTNTGFPSWVSIYSSDAACPGEMIHINSDGGYLAYVFYPGDGTPSDSSSYEDFDHNYLDTGQYIYSIKIYNHCGNDTTIYDTIQISDNIDFTNSGINLGFQTPRCPGAEINFYTSGDYPSYVYDFGDGSSSYSTNENWAYHIYSVAGTYTVAVTVTNHCGIDTTLTSTINILNNAGFDPNNINFNYDAQKCPGSEVEFSGPYGHLSYLWNFGDGNSATTSSSDNQHIYQNTGTYSVSVTTTNHCGQDTTLYGSVFIGNNVGFPNNMNFYTHPNPVCPSDEAGLDTEEGYSSYSWDFGDGSTATTGTYYAKHYYSNVGTYPTSVTITNGCGIDTTLYSAIVVDSNAAFPDYLNIEASASTICPGDRIEFDVDDDFNSFDWDLGDGTILSNSSNRINHIYDSVGTYTVSVTLTNGCGNQITLTRFLIVDSNNTTVDANMFVFSNDVCPGDVFSVIGQNDYAPYTYIFDFGDGTIDTTYGTGKTHAYDSVGTYLISITASNSCGYSASSTITMNVSNSAGFPAQTIYGIANEGNFAGCSGDNILFFFMGLYDNVWDFGDGSTATATETVQTPSGEFKVITHTYSDTGNYTANVTLTNACGNTFTGTVEVKIGGGLEVDGEVFVEPPSGAPNYTTCSGVSFLAFGGSSYDWDFGDGNTLTTLSPQVTHYYSNGGDYLVTVTISNGCGNSVTKNTNVNIINGGGATINGNVISSPSCNGYSDAVASVSGTGGTPPYQFSWNDLNSTTNSIATGLSASTYSVTVTDANACSGTTNITIPETPPISGVGNTVPANCGVADGSIVVTGVSGGTTPYTYSWSNGDSSPTADSLAAGTHSVTITDFAGCSSSQTILLNDNGGVTISSATLNSTSCFGNSDGSADITISGGTSPYSYEWSNGDTTEDISGLFAGTYIVTVTDAIGCKTMQSGSITEPDILGIQPTITNANCGFADGAIDLSTTGGTSPYTFNWSNGNSGNSISGLVAGAYMITLTDANTCNEIFTVNVSNANSPEISDSITDISCNGNSDGAIDLTVIGGTTPYTYLWLHDGSFTQDVSNLDAGSYTIILNDGSGCQTAQTFEILEPSSLTINASSTGAHCGYNDGTATLSVSGGTIPYSFSWQNGGTDSTQTGLSSGSNSVTITDANGCIESTNITIDSKIETQPICLVSVDSVTSSKNLIIWEKPLPALGIDSFHIYRDFLGTYVLIGSQSYSTESEFIDSTAGVNPNTTSYRYKLAAVDSCGNESDLSDFHETIHSQISVNGTDVDMIWDNYEGFGFCCYNIMRDTSGIGNWHLLDQVSNNNFTYTDLNAPSGGSNYRIEVIPPDLCTTNKEKDYNSAKSNTSAINIVGLAVSTTSTDATQAGSCDGTATVIASGGNSPYSYLWSDPNIQTTATATGLCPGTYSVIVTDSKGNVETASANVGLVQGFIELSNNGSMILIAPNPYSETTTISYTITETSEVELEVINLLGERITTLYKGSKKPGEISIKFSAKEMGYGAGIYTVRLIINGTIFTKRLIELR